MNKYISLNEKPFLLYTDPHTCETQHITFASHLNTHYQTADKNYLIVKTQRSDPEVLHEKKYNTLSAHV